MTARELLDAAAARLAEAGVASPRVDAEWLLAEILQIPRLELNLVDTVEPQQAKVFEVFIARRTAREPVQLIIGRAPFRGLELRVGPGVFVPRPETELLAGWAIAQARAVLAEGARAPIVVDLATGSGAIAAAVVAEVPEAQVHAIELDPVAHSYAELNLPSVDLRLGDLAEAFEELNGLVDVVVSNPPYIPLEAWESVQIEARDFDPHLALFSGEDGLDAIRVIDSVAARLLRTGGVLGVEHAEVQHQAVVEIFSHSGRWVTVIDNRDLATRPRYVTAIRSAV